MTLEQSLETIESIKFVCRTLFPPKEQEALRLGIEALKSHKTRREDPKASWAYLLPGETEK